MFLSYLALFILVVVIVIVVYAFIWIHDIPYRLAKKRDHPNLHAIHIACWLSLFTLHALWPFVFLWAITQKPRFEVIVVSDDRSPAGAVATKGHGEAGAGGRKASDADEAAALRQAIHQLHARLDALEKRHAAAGGKS